MSAARRVIIVCIALVLSPVSADAQGFFESLFGSSSPQSYRSSGRRASPAFPDFRYREPLSRPATSNSQEGPVSADRTRFRTLCVRACDGYYFPISGSVSRNAFHRDAQICRRNCGSDAALFYHPSTSGDASRMVDLAGLPYARHPNAFRYRKQLVERCTCKPEPWSPSEAARHQRYAAQEAQAPQTAAHGTGTENAGAPTQPLEPPVEPEAQPEAHHAPSMAEAPEPADRPTDTDTPRKKSHARTRPSPPFTTARGTPTAIKKSTTVKSSGPSNLFGWSLGASGLPKLRWPGD